MINLEAILNNNSVELITKRPNYITFYWTYEREIFLVRVLFDMEAQLSISRQTNWNKKKSIDEKVIDQLIYLCFGKNKDIKIIQGKNKIYLQTTPPAVKQTNILKFRY